MMLGLTVVTGVVDSVSILALGRMFVANMTGNVVFVGFALAGAAGFSLAASLVGLAGFLVGAAVGGQLVAGLSQQRTRLFAISVSAELALLGVGTLVLGLSSQLSSSGRDSVVALLAVAMGIQNAVARHLAVPDLTTTVLTMTLTGIASDLRHGQTAHPWCAGYWRWPPCSQGPSSARPLSSTRARRPPCPSAPVSWLSWSWLHGIRQHGGEVDDPAVDATDRRTARMAP
jgi:hypothetical protein